jgi:RNA polymerase sigma factor (sigma-70 family)
MQQIRGFRVSSSVDTLPAAEQIGSPAVAGRDRAAAEAAVTALYASHALALTRMARAMLGDLGAAEDVVQDAFGGLFRRWAFLTDTSKAPEYLRAAVLNGCRSALRGSARLPVAGAADVTALTGPALTADSADAPLLAEESRRAVLAAVRRLPQRQREALLLRYYLDLSDEEIARAMGVRPPTVRSAVHRGLAALGRALAGEAT